MANELIPRREGLFYPRSFLDMFSEFDRALESAFSGGIGRPVTDWPMIGQSRARTEINENESAVYLCVELPGVKREDIDINVSGRNLMISAERGTEQKGEGEEMRSYRRYQQTFVLPESIDVENLESHYSDGLLEVLMPKTKEATSQHKIEIQSGKGGLQQRFFGGQKSETKAVRGKSAEKH